MPFRKFIVLVLLFSLLVSVAPLAAQDDERVFPVTIEHQFGETIIESEPQRVLSLGFSEQDALLALGVQPIAVRYWYGDAPNAIFPWAQDFVEGEPPVVLNMPFSNLNYEAILELEPDLISAVSAGLTEEEYETLSQIAPTLTQTGDYINFGMPWQEATQMIGDALGKSDEAAEIVAETENRFTAVREQFPQIEGQTIAVAYNDGSTFGYFTDQDVRGRFFTDLGFVIPDDLIEIAGDSFFANISDERIDLLDQDVIAIASLQFVEGGRETLESDPLFSQLEVVENERVMYLDQTSEDALAFSSPLSLTFALDAIVPQLERIYGAQEQATTQCEDGFRLLTHEFLLTEPVCIPEDPQRIVIAWPLGMTSLVRADAPLVGAFALQGAINQFPGWEEELTVITDIGNPPNPEAILALEPDLIMGPYFFFQDESTSNYPGSVEADAMWTSIAPTVVFDWQTTTWRETTDIIFDAAGRADEFDALMLELDERIEELAGLIGNPEEIELTIVNIGAGYTRTFTQYAPGAMIADRVGFSRPASQLLPVTPEEYFANPEAYPGFVNDGFSAEVSLERIDELDSDFILISGLFVNNEDNQAALDVILDSPLWQSLDAVQAGNVHISDVNFGGGDTGVMHYMLDELAEAFGVADAFSENPYVIQAPLPE
ncbi:MAG: ABC transporter substrate-binding protein [Chloroflexota bacterium]